MSDTDLTRRRFTAYFAGTGLGATLLPGVLWTKMQEAGTAEITSDMLVDALALAGLEFSEGERERMLENIGNRLGEYVELRELEIPNDVSPPFHFSPLVPGMQVNRAQEPFRVSSIPVLGSPPEPADFGRSRSDRNIGHADRDSSLVGQRHSPQCRDGRLRRSCASVGTR